ncbi:ABC transporter permease [Clostridia bacterium]|nr:ABC transporter permease [Clostridia bacterium]
MRSIIPKRGRKLNRSLAGNSLLFLIMAACGVFMVLPLVMIANNALKPLDEIFRYPPAIFVRNPTIENFTDLFVLLGNTRIPFSRYIINTLVITVVGTVGHVFCASVAAYPLAKHDFIGKKLLFSVLIISMMFSATVTQVPNYMIITWLGLNNTQWALIFPAFAFSVGLYLMKQFMEQIPDSIIESARLDGASEWRVLFGIIMPNVKPAWLTLAVFQFQALWSNTGGLFIRDDVKRPLQAIMQQASGGGAARAGAAAAVAFILALIPITFFLACQSAIMETMTTSGMKE